MAANWPEKRPGRESDRHEVQKRSRRVIRPFPVYNHTGEKGKVVVLHRAASLFQVVSRLVIIDSIDQFVRSSVEDGCEI